MRQNLSVSPLAGGRDTLAVVQAGRECRGFTFDLKECFVGLLRRTGKCTLEFTLLAILALSDTQKSESMGFL